MNAVKDICLKHDGFTRKRMRAIMERLGVSRSDLAARCGCTPQAISRITVGPGGLGMKGIGLFAWATGVFPGCYPGQSDVALPAGACWHPESVAE